MDSSRLPGSLCRRIYTELGQGSLQRHELYRNRNLE
jgi:hypothetical protein